MSTKDTIDVELKYQLYEASVQCHDADIEFINKQFRYFRKRNPKTLREDFGGTAMLACDWVRQSEEHRAWAIDLDTEPQKYGKKVHYAKLTDEEKERVHYLEGNVLDDYGFAVDVLVAFNFSYFIFKKRQELLNYFKQVRNGLNKDGVFFVDIFGGTEAQDVLVEETKHENHTYYWDCDAYNPLNSEVLYHIHFKTHKDKKKYDKVFTYDWRMWSIREIRELMEEAGFSETHVYWEGEDEDGDGDGNFFLSEEEGNCESWVTYIIGLN